MFFNNKKNDDIIYTPDYYGSDNSIANFFSETETENINYYMKFNDIEFHTIETFISFLHDIDSSVTILHFPQQIPFPTNETDPKPDLTKTDIIYFKTIRGRGEIIIPKRASDLDITRKTLYITLYLGEKNVDFQLPIFTLNQLKFKIRTII